MGLRELLKEPRPKDIFNKITPLANGGGFPCIESAFSGAVCLYIYFAFQTIEIQILSIILTVLVGCSRYVTYIFLDMYKCFKFSLKIYFLI